MSEVLFFLLSGIVLYGALQVVTHRHLLVCALHLAGSMLALSGLFFILGAHFIAMVQVLVYAGAVMVLFIMVVMLFDLKKNEGPLFNSLTKWNTGVLFFFIGLIGGVFPYSLYLVQPVVFQKISVVDTRALAKLLFSDYILAFELMGILLLVIAIGATVLCRLENKEG